MILRFKSCFRRLFGAAALMVCLVPAVGHAACTPVEASIPLPSVTSAAQLQALQGSASGGTLVRGVSSPSLVRLTGCSQTLTTTVRADNVTITKAGETVELAPWLIRVDGVDLTEPKDLSQTPHTFVGDVTLEILLVPVNLPPSLAAGLYNGPLVLNFTD